MKKLFFYLLPILAISSLIVSCGNDDEAPDNPTDPQYEIHIHQPTADDKNQNDTMHMHIEMLSMLNMTVHHANIRIVNIDTNVEIYNGPDDAHVHEDSGTYELHKDIILDSANGVEAHTDWMVIAKVWGHEDGLFEVQDSVQFHVHPE